MQRATIIAKIFLIYPRIALHSINVLKEFFYLLLTFIGLQVFHIEVNCSNEINFALYVISNERFFFLNQLLGFCCLISFHNIFEFEWSLKFPYTILKKYTFANIFYILLLIYFKISKKYFNLKSNKNSYYFLWDINNN